MLKSLASSVMFAFVAHSAALTAWLLPTVGAVVAAEAAYIVRSLRRKKVRP